MYFYGVLIVLDILYVVESRVYCQDSNATPWVPLGFTCPVVCANIINAIERLKLIDFEEIIYRTPKEKSIDSLKNTALNKKDKTISNTIDSKETDSKDGEASNEKFIHRKTNVETGFKKMNDSFDEIQFHKDVIKLAQRAAKTFNGKCADVKDGLLARLKKCARRSNYDGSFLNIMTKMLNKYVKSKYQFTEDMTEILLEKLLGKNTDLRNNIFDVNKLLKYLRQAIHRHKEHKYQDVISLKPQRCLTISLPGCFCKSGFVEDSGQCVKPSDCVDGSLYGAYLARINVL